MRSSVVILGILVLSGCAVGPDYKRPELPIPAQFLEQHELVSTEAVTSRWWRGFNDEVLQSLITSAMQANLDVRAAGARWREARALSRQARLDRYPTVTSAGGYERRKQSIETASFPPGIDRESEQYSAGFEASWELDLFGRVRRLDEAAAARMDAAESDLFDIRRAILAELLSTYIQLRGAQRELEVSQASARARSETRRIIEARAEAGEASHLDVARVRAEEQSTLALLPPIETTIRNAIHQLAFLVGREPGALAAELSGPRPIPGYEGPVTIGEPGALIERRPDVRSAEMRLAAATADIGGQMGNLFPKVTFSGNIGVLATSASRFDSSGAEAYGFGPNITWPAFSLGSIRARVRAADARAEEALALYEKSVLNALREVEDSLVRFGRARAQRDLLVVADEEASRAAAIARTQYNEGLSDLLTVIDAERSQLAIAQSRSQSETDLMLSLINVYRALGSGWDAEAESGL